MKRILIALTTLFCLIVPAATASAAYNPFDNACKESGNASAVCNVSGAKDPISGPNGIIKKVSLLLAIIAGIAAVIIIIVSGLKYITADGDASKVASARATLTGAVVGLLIIAAAESIVFFVVSKL